MSSAADLFRALVVPAFPDEPVPQSVVSPIAREVQEGWEDLEACLQGRPWPQVSLDSFEENAPNIIALTIEAFVYYLPAFMLASLRHPDGDSATYTMYALCPLSSYDTFYTNTCELFSPEQAKVIQAFLELLNADDSFVLFEEEIEPAIALWRKRASA
jgi:hypothetical protein